MISFTATDEIAMYIIIISMYGTLLQIMGFTVNQICVKTHVTKNAFKYFTFEKISALRLLTALKIELIYIRDTPLP